MPLGAFRLNSLARYVVAALVGRTAKGITAFGNAQVDTAQSKFGGASFLGDGTGDYLTVAADNDFLFGAETNSWTIEFFMRSASFANIQVPISNRVGGAGAGQFWCEITTGAKMYWALYNSAGTPTYVNLALAGTAFSTNTWYHVALVNNGGTAKMYINGTQVGANATLSGTYGSSTRSVYVAGLGGAFNFNGHLDEIRISTVARYTGSFTPTTSAFVNDADTILLIHADGTDGSTVFTDDNGVRSKNGISAIGNAQVDTAQSKFGGASAVFDGTGDYLDCNQPIIPASSDFTAEAWVRLNDNTNVRSIIQQYGTGQVGRFSLQYNHVFDKFTLFVDNLTDDINIQGTTTPISTNTWYHVAVTRSGNNWNLWVNGNDNGSDTNSGSVYQGINTYIGARFHNSLIDNVMDGHIDEIRISSTARYTGAFTPSTAAFVNDANTLLLIHADGTDASTDFTDDNS